MEKNRSGGGDFSLLDSEVRDEGNERKGNGRKFLHCLRNYLSKIGQNWKKNGNMKSE